ncbi:MAG: AGE family epimerase/isomerase [Pseudomonadota bacterium]
MIRADEVSTWLYQAALPLWRTAGFDHATGTVWEALDHSGTPVRTCNRRLRVQLRQAASFAMLGEVRLGRQLFEWVMTNGFDPDTGQMAALLSPQMKILTAPNDLYDLAFAGFAAAALIQAGEDVTQALSRIEAAIDSLRVDQGWAEAATHPLPRRQNPHMHLFEMSLDLYKATGASRFLTMAETCLNLYKTVFLQPDGRVLEYYDADLVPLSGPEQSVEPGHMAEWIFLLDRYEVVTGQSCGLEFNTIWHAVDARRDPTGLLPDHSDPVGKTRRLWPQTELLKAMCVMHHKGTVKADAIWEVFERMWSAYFTPQAAGGWYDKRRIEDGALLSDVMPASTFYHIVIALETLVSLSGRASERPALPVI